MLDSQQQPRTDIAADHSNSNNAAINKSEQKDKCVELYELSKVPKKSSAAKPDLYGEAMDGVEVRKYSNKKQKPGPVPKSYVDAINRMMNARKDKELIQSMKDKGNTYTGNGFELKRSPSEAGEMRNSRNECFEGNGAQSVEVME